VDEETFSEETMDFFNLDVPYIDNTPWFDTLNTNHPNDLKAASFFRSRAFASFCRCELPSTSRQTFETGFAKSGL